MKTKVILLCFLFLANPVFGQTTFERQYDHRGNAYFAMDVVETPGGDFIIVGTTGPKHNAMGNYDGLVMKINAAGDTLWTRTFGDYGSDVFTSVLLRNTHIIIVGAKFVFGKAHQGWLLELDQNGNPLLEKTYGANTYAFDGISSIIATDDGGYLLSGTTKSYGRNRTQDVWLIKLNADFDTLWTKTYDMGVISGGVSYDENGGNVIPFQDDGFMVIANTCTAKCQGADPRVYASYLAVDSTGNLVKYFSIKEGPKNRFSQIRPTNDGGAIITGTTSIKDSAIFLGMRSEDMWVLKLNSSADIVWTRIIGKYGVYDGGRSIYQASDGNYILAAYSQMDATPQMDYDNFWLMKLNSVGDTLWVRKWGGQLNDGMFSVKPTADSGIIAVGYRDGNSNPLAGPIPGPADVWVIKTDSDGIILSSYSASLVLDQNYPNPFNPTTPYRGGARCALGANARPGEERGARPDQCNLLCRSLEHAALQHAGDVLDLSP